MLCVSCARAVHESIRGHLSVVCLPIPGLTAVGCGYVCIAVSVSDAVLKELTAFKPNCDPTLTARVVDKRQLKAACDASRVKCKLKDDQCELQECSAKKPCVQRRCCARDLFG